MKQTGVDDFVTWIRGTNYHLNAGITEPCSSCMSTRYLSLISSRLRGTIFAQVYSRVSIGRSYISWKVEHARLDRGLRGKIALQRTLITRVRQTILDTSSYGMCVDNVCWFYAEVRSVNRIDDALFASIFENIVLKLFMCTVRWGYKWAKSR